MLVTLDFETYYASDFGFGCMTTEEYIRDARFEVIGFAIKIDDGPTEWHSADKLTLLSILMQIDWTKVVLLGQNTMFDAAILHWVFGIKPARYADTMSMARGLVGLDTSCSLKNLGPYFKLPTMKGSEVDRAKGKRREDFNAYELWEYGEYCKNDVEMTYALFNILAPCTLPDELKLQDWTIRAFAEPRLVLDGNIVLQELQAFGLRRDTLLRDAGIADVSVLRSDDTFAMHLERLTGVEPPTKPSPKRKNPDGSPMVMWAFSKQDLEFMELLESDDEAVVTLVEARLGTKSSIIESRLKRFLAISRRGPLPVPLLYAGATPTRRWSGTDQINLQNLPRNKLARNPDGSTLLDANGDPVIIPSPLRRAICAPPGMRMASADLSQIELRVNAWQSGQHDVLDILRNGGDVYSDQATALYGYEVTKATGKTIHQLERFVGKTTELQCGYQCGHLKFLHSLKVAAKRDNMVLPDTSVEFAQRVVDGYRTKRNRIKSFWGAAQNALQSVAYGMAQDLGPYRISDYKVHLPNGSYLYYPDLRYAEKGGDEQGCEWSYRRKRKNGYSREKMYGGKFVENITQAVARLFVSDALLRLESVRYPDGSPVFHVVFSVHDELVVLFNAQLDEKWVRATLKWAMTTPPAWALDLPLACDIGIGNNYAECK